MKNFFMMLVVITSASVIYSCAVPEDRYNTQKGAVIGAGLGALAGQAIGHNTRSTLLGTGLGMLIGTVAGNAVDQSHQAGREAAATNKRVVYYDNRGSSLEAVPGRYDHQRRCRTITKRVWENGRMIRETVEEICEGNRYTQEY
jgi:uncharacterized protein YcfJ